MLGHATGGAGVTVDGVAERPDVPAGRTILLPPAAKRTVGAAIEIVIPDGAELPTREAILTALEQRLSVAPEQVQTDFRLALRVLNSRTAMLLVTGRPARFEALDPAARSELFGRWATSRLPFARAVHQAVRKLLLSTCYLLPEGRRAVGLRPPLISRPPAVAWEGPVPGRDPTGDGPVAFENTSREIAPRRPELTPLSLHADRSSHVAADVIVIGSGAGGAVAAARFAEAGRDVVILEAGEYVAPAEMNEDEGTMVPRLFADGALRATDDGSLSLLQGGAVGGGTTVNWMFMLRTPDHVLEEWRRDFALSDLTTSALAPIYDRVESEVHARVVPDDAHSPSNRVILDGARALGWKASVGTVNARGCVRAGTCSLGCRYGAKESALYTFLPRAQAHGARLHANTRAERIEVTSGTKRVHATVRDPRSGATVRTLTFEASTLVLAAGAVETPALLQRSGLGGDGVGRYLRLHPTTAVFGHFDRETSPFAGIPQTAMCDEFMQRDPHGYGFWIECPALTPALAGAALGGFGRSHAERMRRFPHCVPLIVLVRDRSDPRTSHGSVTAARGGRVRIRYRLGDSDRANLVAGVEAAARLQLAAGVRETYTLHAEPLAISSAGDLARVRRARYGPNDLSLFSAHVNGTCRMGTDRATTGCNPDGERWGVPGLYVMDGSLLPTAPGVNPQNTIMVLATMLSERILAKPR